MGCAGSDLAQTSTASDPGSNGNSRKKAKKNPSSIAADAEKAKHFMTYGVDISDPGMSFAEEQLQPQAGLSGEAALSATRMEAAMMDLAPDDALELNRKRKTVRWDERKKKYVKQTEAERAHSSSVKGRHTSGKDGKGNRPVGEMYEKWKKKTKKEVGGENAVEMDRPTPNVRVNKHVSDELKSAEQIRKVKVAKAKNKEKNMEKDKRAKLQNDRKKAAADAKKGKGSPRFLSKANRKQATLRVG
jgi:hypothetical protein